MAITRKYKVELVPDSFRRQDETEDRAYYQDHDPSQHFEAIAATAVRPIIRTLLTESEPAVLDLVAGSDSHLGSGASPSRVVGLGLSEAAMARNPALTERVVHDLNADPALPFDDATFDVVLCTGSVPYLTRPVEVFGEVARVLRPGGLFLVIFDNLVREERATKIWRRSSHEERLAVVDNLFRRTRAFEEPQVRLTTAPVRPDDDGAPSSRPLFAVFAPRRGGDAATAAPPSEPPQVPHRYSPEEIAARKKAVGETLRCPYCDTPLTETRVSDLPFSEWDADTLWVCFAKDCPFTLRSMAVMRSQGNQGVAYRVVYHRERDRLYTVPDVGFRDAD